VDILSRGKLTIFRTQRINKFRAQRGFSHRPWDSYQF